MYWIVYLPKEGVIEHVEQRSNLLQRPRVANLTQIVITVAAASPDPHPLVVSRFLVLAECSGAAKIVLCINRWTSIVGTRSISLRI